MYRPLRRLLSQPLSRPLNSRHCYKALFIFGLSLVLLAGSPSPSISRPAPQQQVQIQAQASVQTQTPIQSGVNAYNEGRYQEAITYWTEALDQYDPGPLSEQALSERALVNENIARAQQQIGETALSLNYWAAAATDYEASGNATQFGRMLSEQAQVYISRGQHQRAIALLCRNEPVVEPTVEPGEQSDVEKSGSVACDGGAYAIALTTQDITGQAAALGSLAETQRLRGRYLEAQQLLTIGIKLVKNNNLTQFETAMRNSLGSVHKQLSSIAARRAESAALFNLTQEQTDSQNEATEQNTLARQSFDKAATIASENNDNVSELRAQLNLLLLSQQNLTPQNSTPRSSIQVRRVRQRVAALIEQLPASRESAYAAVTLAKLYSVPQRDFSCKGYQDVAQQQIWLEKGQAIAATIQDARAESFALGELGNLAECRGQLDVATQLTQQAQLAAGDALESADSLYLWEWQMGRIHLAQGNLESAKAAYTQAITTLETIRSDILTADRDLQFDFRDTVEPVYRQYITLQLQEPSNQVAIKQTQRLPDRNVSEILKTVDVLRLAELQNFFGNDCVLVASQGARDRLLTNDPFTTVISSVVLSDSVVLLATFPDDTTEVVYIRDLDRIIETADQFRSGLKRYIVREYNSAPAQALYQQLIEPLESGLARTNTQTLVFVQDGFLRNIPMAALKNGDRYLIESYAIATTPSLNLTATSERNKATPRALAVGLSQQAVIENGRDFPALLAVPDELDSVYAQLPGSKVLLNEDFTTETLSDALEEESYSILHLATHGQFSTLPEETFIITGSGEDGVSGKLTFGELETIIQQASSNTASIDLITLTACETAKGDDRATLGLAGVAIRAGARSAIASLWKLDDNSSAELVNAFYRNLQDTELSKAQALQQAQISAIERDRNANPGTWAPLILVGNWQ